MYNSGISDPPGKICHSPLLNRDNSGGGLGGEVMAVLKHCRPGWGGPVAIMRVRRPTDLMVSGCDFRMRDFR
jgi:hypothetical protein